jgi:hypothetical protein
MWQETNNPYGAASSQYYSHPQGATPSAPLQFYTPPSAVDQTSFYPGSRSSLEGHVGAQGSMSQHGVPPGYGGNIQPAGGWWTAFGPGGFEGEPPLLEGVYIHMLSLAQKSEPPDQTELGINFSHIQAKSLTVLNPLRRVDDHIMDDADLAGPLLFCFCFATFLLFVSSIFLLSLLSPLDSCAIVQSGKTQFGYIYGVGLLGSASIYALLNLMSEQGIDAYRVASVLGYCLLPMVGVGALSVMFTLK